jgi:hypothetical protein
MNNKGPGTDLRELHVAMYQVIKKFWAALDDIIRTLSSVSYIGTKPTCKYSSHAIEM